MREYPPVWLMMMKLRDIMGKRDAMYKLSDQIELDISFFPHIRSYKEWRGEAFVDKENNSPCSCRE